MYVYACRVPTRNAVKIGEGHIPLLRFREYTLEPQAAVPVTMANKPEYVTGELINDEGLVLRSLRPEPKIGYFYGCRLRNCNRIGLKVGQRTAKEATFGTKGTALEVAVKELFGLGMDGKFTKNEVEG